MRVLVACESSGVVRRAFRARGHDAYSCDLLPAEDASPFHYHGDVKDVLDCRWDMMIGHPPCPYLANSGVQWLHRAPQNPNPSVLYGPERWAAMEDAAAFFRCLMDAPIPRIAIENPIPHRYAVERIGRKYDQTLQPWQYGHGEVKRTCLWLKNLPPLQPTDVVEGREARVHRMPPSPDRWRERSRTLEGIAAAMADQWGRLPALAAA